MQTIVRELAPAVSFEAPSILYPFGVWIVLLALFWYGLQKGGVSPRVLIGVAVASFLPMMVVGDRVALLWALSDATGQYVGVSYFYITLLLCMIAFVMTIAICALIALGQRWRW